MNQKLKHVQTERSRHGRIMYYFRPTQGSPRVRLPDDPGSPEFKERYDLLMAAPADLPKFKATGKHKDAKQLEKFLRDRVSRAVHRDKTRRGITSTITADWAVEQLRKQKYCCALTGLPFKIMADNPDRMQPFAPSLDRIDVSKGYVEGNVQIVTLAINVMRLDWGANVFNLVVKSYKLSRTKNTGREGIAETPVNEGKRDECGDPG